MSSADGNLIGTCECPTITTKKALTEKLQYAYVSICEFSVPFLRLCDALIVREGFFVLRKVCVAVDAREARVVAAIYVPLNLRLGHD